MNMLHEKWNLHKAWVKWAWLVVLFLAAPFIFVYAENVLIGRSASYINWSDVRYFPRFLFTKDYFPYYTIPALAALFASIYVWLKWPGRLTFVSTMFTAWFLCNAHGMAAVAMANFRT